MKTLKCLGIALIYALAVTSPAWAKAFMAHADPGSFAPEVIAYTAQHSATICHQLDTDPTLEGVQNASLHIINSTPLTVTQAGEVVGLSVRTRCIWHAPLMAQFAAAYATPKGVIIG